MRKIKVGAFTSIDGVMQGPGGPEEDPTGGFAYGGWVAPLFDDKVGAAVDELMKEPFDLLLGRKTYDIFAAHWPYSGDEMGAMFDGINKYVASRNPDLDLTWQNSVHLGVDPIATLRKLKQEDGRALVTQGSADFLQTLFQSDLVDEITVFTFPVVLGKGKRLFGDTVPASRLKLIDSTVSDNGVLLSRYAVDGPVETGSFEFEQPTEAELKRRASL
jgi:dihydrofolate reductase